MIRRCLGPFTGAIASLVADSALAGQYHLPEPQSFIAQQIYDLHALITWAIVLIFIVVFGAMTSAIIRHRKSAGRQSEQFHENITVEIVWAVIPLLILIGTAYPAIKT
ncbi:MAG: cytochrome c oxidase subunit II, partial [Betaproteobacteria bacterium]|nr:cytochrome c oxidase subunit II [Betaproteobacteria bacterium]